MRWTMVDEINEIECGLKEIKMKHDQWSVDWQKSDETWTMKCGLKEMIWDIMKCELKEMRQNINNEVWAEGNKMKHEQWSRYLCFLSMLFASFLSVWAVHCDCINIVLMEYSAIWN